MPALRNTDSTPDVRVKTRRASPSEISCRVGLVGRVGQVSGIERRATSNEPRLRRRTCPTLDQRQSCEQALLSKTESNTFNRRERRERKASFSGSSSI